MVKENSLAGGVFSMNVRKTVRKNVTGKLVVLMTAVFVFAAPLTGYAAAGDPVSDAIEREAGSAGGSFFESIKDAVSKLDIYKQAKSLMESVMQMLSDFTQGKDVDTDIHIDDPNLQELEDFINGKDAELSGMTGGAAGGSLQLSPLSEAAGKKYAAIPLSEGDVTKIRQILKPYRPDPSVYLSKEYMEQHLRKFEENGCYRIVSEEPDAKQWNSEAEVFVFQGKEVHSILETVTGPEALAEAFGLQKEAFSSGKAFLVRYGHPENLHMPSGNESGVPESAWCPGGITAEGLDQAVISAGLAENCEYKELFAGDGEWKQIQ